MRHFQEMNQERKKKLYYDFVDLGSNLSPSQRRW